MKPTFRASIAVLAEGACLLAAFGGPAGEARAGQRGEPAALMRDLSDGFTALEKELRAGDTGAIAVELATLTAVVPRMRDLEPEVHADLLDEFGRHVQRFGELMEEVGDLAAQSRLAGAEQAFDELRATCVSCHLKFRSDNEERGTFPARDNTVVGTVSLRDADGVAREDRSAVLVFLEPTRAAASYAWQRDAARLSQKSRQFLPRVLPVVVGTSVEFPNDDTIFHNVFSLSKTKPFDLGTYEPGHTASVSMDRTGLVKVYCNIHPDMNASIVVLANPWFALTDRNGGFVICNAPAGEYSLRAWNDLGAEASQSVSLGSGSDGPVQVETLELRESLRVVRHNDKFGKPYRERY